MDNKLQRIKSVLRKILVGLFFFSMTLNLFAQSVIIESGDRDIEVSWFGPSAIANLREYGFLQLLGYFTTYFIIFVFLAIMLAMFRSSLIFIKSRGRPGEIEIAENAFKTILMGIFVGMGMIMVYAVVGYFFGTGNIFNWSNKLAQCGDGVILFRAEYRAGALVPGLFDNEVLTYCCEEISFIDKGENEGEVNVQDGYQAVGVGDSKNGGWLFIGDPKEGKHSYLAGGRNIETGEINGTKNCQSFQTD